MRHDLWPLLYSFSFVQTERFPFLIAACVHATLEPRKLSYVKIRVAVLKQSSRLPVCIMKHKFIKSGFPNLFNPNFSDLRKYSRVSEELTEKKFHALSRIMIHCFFMGHRRDRRMIMIT